MPETSPVEAARLAAAGAPPIGIGIDTGRAKPFVAAVSTDPVSKPKTVTLTRKRYYYEMHYQQRAAWEERRTRTVPALSGALDALSSTGGLSNCKLESWVSYLEAETANRELLDGEYVELVERAVWRMRMFRWKKAALDRSVSKLMKTATEGQPVPRPLVFAIGAAGFQSTGRGELPVPTSSLSVAFKRGLARVASTGRSVVVLSPDEFRTTMCCCACGAVTEAAVVNGKRSRRLRSCNQCQPTGKWRDRDVQGARNILWIGIMEFFGDGRPAYLCRKQSSATPTRR